MPAEKSRKDPARRGERRAAKLGSRYFSFRQCRFPVRVFVFRLVNDSLERRTHDVLNRIYSDLQLQAGAPRQPPCTDSIRAVEIEGLYGGCFRQASGFGTLCGDRTGFAGRFAAGSFALALSTVQKGNGSSRITSVTIRPQVWYGTAHKYERTVFRPQPGTVTRKPCARRLGCCGPRPWRCCRRFSSLRTLRQILPAEHACTPDPLLAFADPDGEAGR